MTGNKPWETPWEAEHLEVLDACPICGGTEREVMHDSLKDNVFLTAPGIWTMYRCRNCTGSYLNPRPDRASIGAAYGTYYTHTPPQVTRVRTEQLNFFQRIRRGLANGYLNARYGTSRLPEYVLGRFVLRLFPSQRDALDAEFRYLPKPFPGQRLLDVGCGNGAFLATAASAGWSVAGVDFDPSAVAAARSQGFDVKLGSVDVFANSPASFDVITLSHVIEHVHDPLGLLRDVSDLLQPGGVLYLETPNIDSVGAKIYGGDWRGIESPRHLVLFNHGSINRLLELSGFETTRIVAKRSVAQGMFRQSANLRSGRPRMDMSQPLPLLERLLLVFSSWFSRRTEFLTIVAAKTR